MKKKWIVVVLVVAVLLLFVAAIFISYNYGKNINQPVALGPVSTAAPVIVNPVPAVTAIVFEPTKEQPVIPEVAPGWIPYESEGGIPYNGITWAVDVAPDEIEVLTGGPACIAGVCLPGGTERGSVILLLPGTEVIHYEVTDLIAGFNWHGSYRPIGKDPTSEVVWRSLAEDRILAMQQAPNCTSGKGCKVLDVLVVGPGNVVVAQWKVGSE